MQVCLESPVCQTRFWSIVRTAVVAAAGAIGECCGRAVVASARRQTLRLWADGGGNPKGRTTVVAPIARTTIGRRSSISRPRLSWKVFLNHTTSLQGAPTDMDYGMQVCLESSVCGVRFCLVVRTAVVAAADRIGDSAGRRSGERAAGKP